MRIEGSKIVATVDAVKAAERRAIENGVTEAMLIENAAAGLVAAVRNLRPRRVAVVYGKGNNGADGLVAARHLAAEGYDVTVIPAFAGAYNASLRAAAVVCGAKDGTLETLGTLTENDCILDAVFGTGGRAPTGEAAATIEAVNAATGITIAVDIPSGLDADTGEATVAVRADRTVTFGCLKTGLLVGVAPDYVGDISVWPIGIMPEPCGTLTDASILPPRRKPVSHKNTYGHVYVVGGSRRMTGAPVLSAMAAVGAGAGLTTLVTPDFGVHYDADAAMCMRIPIPERDGFAQFDESLFAEICGKATSIVIGNGMGLAPDLPQMLRYLGQNFTGNLVVDADGLNVLSRDTDILAEHRCRLILTPHLGELKRFGLDGDVATQAETLAKRLGAVVAAKSTVTVITDGKDVYYNAAGTPALAKGGSGDMLAGIVAAYAVRLDPLRATAAACYKLGATAEQLSGNDDNGLTAGAVIKALG